MPQVYLAKGEYDRIVAHGYNVGDFVQKAVYAALEEVAPRGTMPKAKTSKRGVS